MFFLFRKILIHNFRYPQGKVFTLIIGWLYSKCRKTSVSNKAVR